ncbi:MAG: hypothetical protein FWC62_09460 [Firmicutes bacterium]|nr:hypothetical protein [Bacillota bacterium]
MDYREMYFNLFRVQADVIEELKSVIKKQEDIVTTLILAHLAAEEMVIGAKEEGEGL